MQEQTYARYALPGLLIILVTGMLAVLVLSGSGDGDKDAGAKTPTTTVAKTSRKSMRVRPGDNPSAIAERAGISVERLLELNPRVDPRALQVGEKLKLVP